MRIVAALLLLFACSLQAQEFPSRAVRIIVPWSPG